MTLLTRQHLIEQLSAAEQGTVDASHLAHWAFDQFYAEEAGSIEFEPGYRRVIGETLDDLMFGDEPDFAVSTAEIRKMIQRLATAEPAPDDEDEDEDEEAAVDTESE